MIFVTLGTQDKAFTRLLDAIENQILNGQIEEEVIVQAGYTKYESKHMKIYKLISSKEFNSLMKRCDLLLTHAGVGSIMTGLQHHKTVIAAARLKEYNEHTNNHQLDILKEFTKQGYILALEDFNRLDEVLKKAKTFKPKKFKSNNQNFVKMIEDFIDQH